MSGGIPSFIAPKQGLLYVNPNYKEDPMTMLERIASDHRVHIRHALGDGGERGDPIIPGRNGRLYTDDGKIMVCFTDDGRKRPFPTKLFKTKRLQVLQPFIKAMEQEGDFEFIAEIRDTHAAIHEAIRVLHVKRIRTVTEGVRTSLERARAAQKRKEATA